jgi:limonene-1,2-epoxide hydrolase
MSNTEIVADFIAAWEAKDVDRILTFFADGATYHNIPMPKLTGIDQIRSFVEPFLKDVEKVTFETLHSAENADGTVLNERVDSFLQKNGKTLRFEVMGVFEFKGGKITAWRDYFDMKDVERQMAG